MGTALRTLDEPCSESAAQRMSSSAEWMEPGNDGPRSEWSRTANELHDEWSSAVHDIKAVQ